MKSIILIIAFLGFSLVFSQVTIFDVARRGTVAEMTSLLTAQPQAIESKTAQGFTPLILACYNSNDDVATFLIQQKANLNNVSPNGTALMASVVKNNQKLAKLLLENKANPDLQDGNGFTALHYAIQFRNYEMIALLMQYQPQITIKDNMGMTAKAYAINLKDEQIQHLLKL